MVKVVQSTVSMAVVAADDMTSLLQLSAGVRQSQGQRILAAVAKGDDAICVQAAAGDVAPVSGSFTARASQQAVIVAAGSVAGEAGSFCVAKQDVLLIQRTFGLNTARDFEAALGSKSNSKRKTTTTTTTQEFEDRDFGANLSKVVKVKTDGCPSVEDGLLQTVDASVSDKKHQKKVAQKTLNDDQLRVCQCRNFLKDSVNMPNFFETVDAKLKKAVTDGGTALLQRNLDAALARKGGSKKAKKTTTTTTTTTLLKDTNLWRACAAADDAFDKKWAEVARQLNNPAHGDLFKDLNITGGWQHCDQSWVVLGACREYMTKAAQAATQAAADKAAEEKAAEEKAAKEKAAEEKAAEEKAAEEKAAEEKAAKEKAAKEKAAEENGEATKDGNGDPTNDNDDDPTKDGNGKTKSGGSTKSE